MNENTSFWFHEFRKLEQSYPAEDLNKDTIVSNREALFTILQLIEPNFTEKDADKILMDDLLHGRETIISIGFSRDGVAQLIENFRKAEIKTCGGFDVVAVVYETTGELISESATLPGFNDTMRREAIEYRTLYPAAKLALAATRFNEEAIEQLASLGVEIGVKVRGDIEKRFKRLAVAVDEQVELKTNSALQRIENSSSEILDDLKQSGTKQIENAKSEMKESFILQDAMELWDTKAAEHKANFVKGSRLFSAGIIIPVVLLLFLWSPITQAIMALAPNDKPFALGNLVVVTIPVLAYAWVMRLVSRFTLQNLNLSDDAAQRSVMAKTYIRLVGEGKADEHKDRAIMLNALFRPVPGAKEQDLQPPNLSDFISK